METKARYVFVGVCSLVAIALAFGLLMFSLKRGDRDQIAYYAVEFSGGVAGLSVGNDVRFNGIKVGTVRSFTINQDDPSRVRVIITMAADTPIREDSEANLTMQGITGLAVVDISGGTAASPRMRKGNEDNMPLIKSRRSSLGSVIDEAPNLVIQANELLARSSKLLSPENQASLTSILKSFEVTSAALARQSGNLETTIENLALASANLNKVMDSAYKIFGVDLDAGVAHFSQAFKNLDDLITELEPGARRLTGGTADEILRVLSEAQALLRNMNALVHSLQSDPQRLFFGDPDNGQRLR